MPEHNLLNFKIIFFYYALTESFSIMHYYAKERIFL